MTVTPLTVPRLNDACVTMASIATPREMASPIADATVAAKKAALIRRTLLGLKFSVLPGSALISVLAFITWLRQPMRNETTINPAMTCPTRPV